jgi:spermidine/putrescine transport system permease protein
MVPDRATPSSSPSIGQRPRLGAWLLLTPMIAWVLLFVLAPAAIMLVYSFCTRDDLGEVVYQFSLENYNRVVDILYLKILWRSVLYAGLTTLLCLVIGYPVAFAIARSADRWRDRLLVLVMIPFWTSFLIRTYAWITILKHEGLLNGALTAMKLNPVDLLYTPTAVIIGLVYAYLPFMILPIYGSIEKLDPSLIEAALDLGAPPRKVFAKIILPLTKPGIIAGILLVFVPAIGMFAVTDLLGGAKVPLIGNIIQNQFGQARDWPFGAALGTILLLLFAVAFWLSWKHPDAQDQ